MVLELGLKAGTDPAQFESRFNEHPEVFEFYLEPNDVSGDGLKRLSDEIDQMKSMTSKIILHHPMKFHGEHVEMITPEKQQPALYKFLQTSTETLLQLAYDKDIQLLVHGAYMSDVDVLENYYPTLDAAREVLFERTDYCARNGQDKIMFENSISPIYFYGDPTYDRFIFDRGYRLAYDTSHTFIARRGNNDELIESLKLLAPHTVHYHLVDSLGKTHDSLQLGTGKIDWKRVVPTLNPKATSIYEINLADNTQATEMLKSHEYLVNL